MFYFIFSLLQIIIFLWIGSERYYSYFLLTSLHQTENLTKMSKTLTYSQQKNNLSFTDLVTLFYHKF